MRRLLPPLAALAAAALAVLAWRSLAATPSPGGGGVERRTDVGHAARAGEPETIPADAAARLGAVALQDAQDPGHRAVAEREGLPAGEHVAFVLATSGPEDEPVTGLSVARARWGEERRTAVPELRPAGRPGLYELRWPISRGGIDLVLEADGFLPAAVGALVPSSPEAPRAVRLARPSSLAVR
ncbi:MAG: hypothetical protein VX460_15140, partial [Planctomycetota bacterium]|nr:hypothetical protein [Planctomycetota bacterium]